MPAIRSDTTILRLIKDVTYIRSILNRVTVNLPLFDISNENSPAQITADQNNYVPGNYDLLKISSDQAGRTITGFRGGIKGRFLRLFNVGSYEIYLANQDAGSNPENRIISPTGFDIIINAGGEIVLYYDSTQQRWISSYSSNADRISCELELSGNQSLPNASYEVLSWGSVITDTGGFFNAGTPTLITIPESGWYYLQGIVIYDNNGTNFRETIIQQDSGLLNKMRTWDSRLAVTGSETIVPVADVTYATIGREFRLYAWQNSGGALNVMQTRAGVIQTRFVCVKL